MFHHSHLSLYRSPFGAVSCNTRIELAIGVGRDFPADEVFLRLWRGESGEELLPMAPTGEENSRVLYRTAFTASATPGLMRYYFLIRREGMVFFYGNNPGEKGGIGALYDAPPPSYQITVYLPRIQTPDWFKNSIVYQIFVDRFYNGNPDGKVSAVKKGSLIHACWEDDPIYIREKETGRILAYDFAGGNLAGVMAKLPYLADLGISAIYLNPVFEASSNHKYDTADYKKIDPMFGDNGIFTALCAKARELGIAVILDGVFSHTGADSIYFNKEGNYAQVGAYQSKNSPYFSWYRFKNYPDEYESWWGVAALPNVNEMEPSYRDFIIHDEDSVLKHWLKLGVKGWRLDVADELPDEFIREFRQTMKETDADSVLIGEVWEDASHKISYNKLREYFNGNELDSVTNYPFRQAALDFLLGRSDSAAVGETLLSLYENYPAENFYAALNLVGSHDVPRILTALGGHEIQPELPYGCLMKTRLSPAERQLALTRLQLLVLWQMTFPGAPHIYYGDEAGVEGYNDPLNRRSFPWGKEEKSLTAWYKKLTGIRNTYGVLRTGFWLPLTIHPDIFGYVRMTKNGRDAFEQAQEDNVAVIAINRGDGEITARLDISRWSRGMMFDVLNGERETAVGDGQFSITLKPHEGKLLISRLAGENKSRGILLHLTSLPSARGIGGLGEEADRFIDFLAAAGQKYWQILPLNPAGIGKSPYRSGSAFAAETLLIDIDWLRRAELLTSEEVSQAGKIHGIDGLAPDCVDYDVVRKYKEALFRLAFNRFALSRPDKEYTAFIETNKYWLTDYALYSALAAYFGQDAWNNWPEEIANREKNALARYKKLLAREINYHLFLQFIFQRQWDRLRRHAAAAGVRIIGDLPIFVDHHGADVWAHQELFKLDVAGNPSAVAGVPPDYFNESGQLWGNPLYRWEVMAKDDYRWWRERLAHIFGLVDLVRLDHFRGFAGYWQVAAKAKTAAKGRWLKGPGKHFFTVLEKYLGHLPVIAEDLGVITPDVAALRRHFHYPGMKVLQFSFTGAAAGRPEPLDCDRNMVIYTGTHDNKTTLGWYRELRESGAAAAVNWYLGEPTGVGDDDVAWRMVELAYQCKAETVIIPLQDILGLDDKARMNTPGTEEGNWRWRCPPGRLTTELAARLASLAGINGRGGN